MMLKLWPRPRAGRDAEPAQAEFHENAIPEFVESALESLYGCPMCTLLRFSQYYPLESVTTYVSRVGGNIGAVILFRRERGQVIVYNEQIALSGAELSRFLDAVYARYPEVRKVSLYAIDCGADAVGYPLQRLECLEEISFALPGEPSAYLDMLGKNMAAKIRRFNRKIFKELSDVRIDFVPGSEAAEATVRGIVALNGMRMSVKKQISYYTEEETRKTMAFVRRYGVVGTVTIGGKLSAGIVLLRIGSNYCMQMIAHDPAYDRYNLGTLCCFHGISYAIQHGGRRFDFGWGRFEYKYRMLGAHTDLYRFNVYRTPGAMLADAPSLCAWSLWAARRRLKLWLARPDAPGAPVLAHLKHGAHILRNIVRTWAISVVFRFEQRPLVDLTQMAPGFV